MLNLKEDVMNQYVKNEALNILNQIPPGKWRANFVLMAVVGVLLMLIYFPKFSGFAIFSAVVAQLIYALIKRTAKLYPQVMQRLVRKGWRLVIATRQFYKVSEETEFFHVLTIIVVLISFIYFLITKNIHGYALFNSVILILLGSAAVFDASARISWLMKKAWAKVIGKAAIAGLGAALIFVASAVAKQTVGEITHADSQYFPEFTGFLTSLYTPLLFGLALTCIGLLLAFLEFLGVVSILFFIAMPLSLLIQSFLGKEHEARFFDRIRLGKRGVRGSVPGSSGWRVMIYVMRPMALGMAIYVIASSVASIISHFSESIEDAEKHVLVMMQYHPNTECANLDKKLLIAKLKDDGVVSAVSIGPNKSITFTTQRCTE